MAKAEVAASRSPYEVLGVSQDCNQAAITKAFRRRALETHPDKLPTALPGTAGVGPFTEVLAAYTLLKDEDARRTWDRAAPRAAADSGKQDRPGVKLRTPKQYYEMARASSARSAASEASEEQVQRRRHEKEGQPPPAAGPDLFSPLRASAQKAATMRVKMEAATAEQQQLAAEAARARCKEWAAAEEKALKLDAERARQREQEKAHAYGFAPPVQTHRSGGFPTPQTARRFASVPGVAESRPAAPVPPSSSSSGGTAASPGRASGAPAASPGAWAPTTELGGTRAERRADLDQRPVSASHGPNSSMPSSDSAELLGSFSRSFSPWRADETARAAAAEMDAYHSTWAPPPQLRQGQRPSTSADGRSNSAGSQWAEVTGVAAMAAEERMERCIVCGRTIEVHVSHTLSSRAPSSCPRCRDTLEQSGAVVAAAAAEGPRGAMRSSMESKPSSRSSTSEGSGGSRRRAEADAKARKNSLDRADGGGNNWQMSHSADDTLGTDPYTRQPSQAGLQRRRVSADMNTSAKPDKSAQQNLHDGEEDAVRAAFAWPQVPLHRGMSGNSQASAYSGFEHSHVSEASPGEPPAFNDQFLSSAGISTSTCSTLRRPTSEGDILGQDTDQLKAGGGPVEQVSLWGPEAELLREMGFDEPGTIQLALECTNGNIAEALELLV